MDASTSAAIEACLKADGSVSPRDLDVAVFCDAVTAHRVVPLAAAWVAGASDAPQELRRALSQLHRQQALHELHRIATLEWWGRTLGPLPWLLLKGRAIQAAFDPGGEIRAYSDLDVLIRPSDLREILDRSREAGAALVERDWAEIVEQDGGELQLIAPSSVVIDLHWELHDGASLRSGAVIRNEELFARSIEAEIGGRRVLTLAAEDALAHLARHTAGSGGSCLLWYRDLDRVIRSQHLDHHVVRERIEAHGALLATVVLLDRCRQLLSTPVPVELRPSSAQWAWAAVARVTRRLAGPPRVHGGPSLDRLLLRSLRHDGWSSLRALWMKLTMALKPGRDRRAFEPGSKTLEDLLEHVSGHPSPTGPAATHDQQP